MTEPATTNDPVAKPWWQSKVILASVAGLILITAQQAGYLKDVTQDQLLQWLLMVAPIVGAIAARFGATHVVTGTAEGAKAINVAAEAKGVDAARVADIQQQ